MFFFFNDTATTEIYTLSLHDALPIFHDPASGAKTFPLAEASSHLTGVALELSPAESFTPKNERSRLPLDRKSTRLNSSHANISYAVFCLKKKKKVFYHHIFLLQLLSH